MFSAHINQALKASLTVATFAVGIFVFVAPAIALETAEERDFDEAMRLCALGHYGEAKRLLRVVQSKFPKSAVVLTALGNAYLNDYNDVSGGVDKAEKCFRKAIELDPEYGRSYAHLAECCDTRGDFKTGIKLATKALSVKKPDYEAYKERAGAYSNLKRDSEALADMEQYLKHTPKVERKHLVQRATILENLKQYDRALAEYRKLLKEKYEDQVVYREVACLRGMNKNDEALKSLNGLINHNKQDDAGYLSRARLLESLGRHQEAVADYTKAYELLPSTNALKERAAVYKKMGRNDLADKDRKEAERL